MTALGLVLKGAGGWQQGRDSLHEAGGVSSEGPGGTGWGAGWSHGLDPLLGPRAR